jgi:hypothetical protein
MADLPMMAERIDPTTHAPAMPFLDRINVVGARRKSARHRLGIGHRQEQLDRAAAE